MAEIVNLRSARKARARAEAEAVAARNRVTYGRTKGQKLLEEAERARGARKLENIRRELPLSEEGGD